MQAHPVANLFPFIAGDEYAALVEDIRLHGQREPIWTLAGQILDGRNRYRACSDLGIAPNTREYTGPADTKALIDFVLSLNLQRRHLTSSQRAVLALDVEKLLAEDAESERRAKISHFRQTGETMQTFAPSQTQGKASEQAASTLKTNHSYVTDAKKLAAESPDLVEDIRTGTLTIPEAKALARQPEAVRQQAIERKRSGQAKSAQQAIRDTITYDFAGVIPAPVGAYHSIVIDPPWDMQKIDRDARPNQALMDYPTMTLAEIAALPVPALAEPDCHLYLWTTHKYLPDALTLVAGWGFHYQCLLTWVKNVGMTPFSWMYSTEHVIFARRGNLPLLVMGRRLDFAAPVREHSRKPDMFYDLVRTCSPGPRLDMFAREPHDGFAVWGNEPTRFVEEEVVA